MVAFWVLVNVVVLFLITMLCLGRSCAPKNAFPG